MDAVPAGIDPDAVTAWLRARLPSLRPPLRFRLLAGGRSNLTFRIDDAARHPALVLRRPPLHGVLPGAHDMGREYRIIEALGPTAVPVPPAVGLCEDETVTGAPFSVMGFVDGLVLRDATGAQRLGEARREQAASSLVVTLAALHAVDPGEVGLGSLGRREDYVARQLRTWSRQWGASRTRDLPAIDEAEQRLRARPPAQQRCTIVHGDYRLDNVILGSRGDVAAVLDWELCTLGDPLADLGLLLVYWAEPGEARTALPDAPSTLPGFPGRAGLVERYATTSDLHLDDLDYYMALGYWKLAIVLEGVHARVRAGAYGESAHGVEGLAERVEMLAGAALDATARAGR